VDHALGARLSIFFWARRSDSTASSEPADACTFFVRVFSSLRTALLRARPALQ
jgi:hypothetical protein